MDGRGAWRNNVFVERLWRSVKHERVYLKAHDGVSAARADIGRYLGKFNGHPGYSSLHGLTPLEASMSLFPTQLDSTYNSGKAVPITGATSFYVAPHGRLTYKRTRARIAHAFSALRPQSGQRSGSFMGCLGPLRRHPFLMGPGLQLSGECCA